MPLPALVHVLPDDDAIAHEPSERCVCGPHRVPLGIRYSGHLGQHVFGIVHPRLDGQPHTTAPEGA